MTRRTSCPEFYHPDSRFSYEKDGCTMCDHRRKENEALTILTKIGLKFSKCLKGFNVKKYYFREDNIQKLIRKDKEFVVKIRLSREITGLKLKEAIEQRLNSEVEVLLEGQVVIGADVIDVEMYASDELEDLGFIEPKD